MEYLKQTAISNLRQIRLLTYVEELRFIWLFAISWRGNNQFIKKNPDVLFPPYRLREDN